MIDQDKHKELEVARLSDFAELSSDWFWEQDANFRFVSFSGSRLNLLCRKDSDFIGKTRWELPIFPIDDMEEHIAICKKHASFRNFHYEIIDAEGNRQCFAVSGVPIFDADGAFTGYRGVGSNVTELYRSRKALKEAQDQLTQVVVRSPIASFVIDSDHVVTHWNKACEQLSGLKAENIIGTDQAWKGFYTNPRPVLADLVLSDANSNMLKKHYGEHFRKSTIVPDAYEVEDYFPNLNGGCWLLFTAAPLKDEHGSITGAVEILQDITYQKKQEERILHQAHFDSLTGLPNRFLAMDRLDLLLSEAERNEQMMAVFFLDLDDFKKINDTLGHEVGDKVLVQAAARLRSIIRGSDTIGRLGGDEFIVILSGIDSVKQINPVAENLLTCFQDAFTLDGRELLLTASIGVAVYPEDGTRPDELLRNADSAMYYSKGQGRNAYHFFKEEMNAGVERRLLLEEQLYSALERGEFYLNYQPVIDLKSGDIVGAEALLRWNNQVFGVIPPDEFIPIAEQTGLITELGYFVLAEALYKTQQWRQVFRADFNIAVNLSPLQFRDPQLTIRIKELLGKFQLPGSCLTLEITEGVLLGNQSNIHKAFKKMSELQVQLSMDDFGTGYSSLSYLRNFPFDTLKIDRSFIGGFETDPTAPALINATISMAHALGLEVVAEGVELDSHLDYLKQHECNFGQGYYFSKPVVDEDLFRLLLRQKSKK